MSPPHRIVQKSYNKLDTTGPTQAKIREYLMCSISHSPITGDSQMPEFARGNVEFTIVYAESTSKFSISCINLNMRRFSVRISQFVMVISGRKARPLITFLLPCVCLSYVCSYRIKQYLS